MCLNLLESNIIPIRSIVAISCVIGTCKFLKICAIISEEDDRLCITETLALSVKL